MGDLPGRRPGTPPWVPTSRVLLAVVSVLILAGCRVDVAVDVDAGTNGGGHVRAVVTLDKEAAAEIPDLAEQLRVDDLKGAGWNVEGPSPAAGDGVTLRATRPFASPGEAARAIQELSGSEGPFRSLRLTRERTFWKTRTRLAGSIDLTAGLDVFSDDTLNERLGGPNLGVDPAAVERELGRSLGEVFTFELSTRLPGGVESNAPKKREGAPLWPAGLGQTVPIVASAEAWNVLNIGFAAGSLLAAIAFVVVLVRRSRAISWG